MRVSRALYKAALVTVVVIVLAAVAMAGPAVKIAEREYDFGKTFQHVTLSHDFVIESIGDDTLVVRKVIPGCGCTQAPLRDSVLAPGEKTVLTIIFSTRSYAGKITKHPYLLTNLPGEKVELTITADVLIDPDEALPLKISPSEVEIPPTASNGAQGLFLIQNMGPRDLRLSVIDDGAGMFDVNLPQGVKAGETVQGSITLKKSAGQGMFERSITLEVNDPDRSRYSLPIKRLASAAAGK